MHLLGHEAAAFSSSDIWFEADTDPKPCAHHSAGDKALHDAAACPSNPQADRGSFPAELEKNYNNAIRLLTVAIYKQNSSQERRSFSFPEYHLSPFLASNC